MADGDDTTLDKDAEEILFRRMQQRGFQTRAEVMAVNEIPLEREFIVAVDTGEVWLGDGVTPVSGLPTLRDGLPGASAYQEWLELGNSGSEADFIASIRGDKGDPGAAGPDQPSALFPVRRLAAKFQERARTGALQHARVIAMGDSIALFKWHSLLPLLNQAIGGTAGAYPGVAIGSSVSDTRDPSGWTMPGVTNSGATGVTLQTNAFDVWFSGYADLYATGGSKAYGTFGGSASWDQAKIYYPREAGAGTFKVQVDGVDEPGYTSVDASGTGLGIITITRSTVAARAVTVVNLTGTHRVIGAAFERSDRAGVVFSNISQGGIALDQQTDNGYANFQTFLADFQPDIITFEMKESSRYLAAAMETLLDVVDAGAPLATFVGIGSTPLAVNDDDQVIQNAQIRAACRAHGKIYWDGYTPLGSYEIMNALGWAGDGIHVDENASSFLAAIMASDLGLFDAPGADMPRNVRANRADLANLYVGNTRVNASLTDLVFTGLVAGQGFVTYQDVAGVIRARIPVGGPSSAAIMPNTAQLGPGNARWTADVNGIKARTPDGASDANVGGAQANFGMHRFTSSYTTATRPAGATLGQGAQIVDSTLGKVIMWWNGAWRDPSNLNGPAI